MIYEAIGKVVEICPVQTFTSGFSKRSIIIDTKEADGKYPNVTKFDAVKDKCSLLDGIKVGDSVKVGFAIDGRTWDGPKGRTYFVDLKIIRISSMENESNCPEPATPTEEMDGEDEMPF